LSSRAFFEDTAFDEATIAAYKKDLKFFTELRIQARQDAQETVDFSAYERQIRRPRGSAGRPAFRSPSRRDSSTSPGWPRREGFRLDDPESWSEEKTRAETDVIKTRITRMIEQDLADDPYAQTVFSELLKKAIREAEALFDHPHKQYVLFKELEEQTTSQGNP
jgi:type I restriction enzyme, R subunit